MSLSAFHFVFIVFSTLLALGLGVWCVWGNLLDGYSMYLGGALGSFSSGVGSVVLGVWFFRMLMALGSMR